MKRVHGKLISGLIMYLAIIVMVTLMLSSVSEVQASTILKNPVAKDKGNGDMVAVWDCVYFGHYPQSKDGKGGFVWEPIKWRVLSVEGNDALLLADKNLDVLPYHEEKVGISWEISTLRSWLNGYEGRYNACGKDFTQDNFLDIAFTSAEQDAIKISDRVNDDNPNYGTDGGNVTKDKAFLISYDEVTNPFYGFHVDGTKYDDTRKGKNTDYVASNGNMSGAGYADFWWISTPGVSPYYAAVVDHEGYVDPYGSIVNGDNVAVRPALRMDLSSNFWRYAGIVSSDGKEAAYIDEKAVKLDKTTFTYNGSDCKPGVTISGLKQGTDYTVAYKNNKSPGTATAIITGTGNYVGTITKNFTIKKASLSGIKISGKTVTYNGSAHTVTVSIPSGAKVTYKTSSGGTYSTTKPTRTSAGTTTVYYKVTKTNYNDVTGSVKIVVNKRFISSVALSYTKTTYSGSAKKPTVTVKNSSGTKLTKDTHYTVTYASGRTKVGRYKVTITGKGNYTGTITRYFTIVPKAPSSASAKLYGHDDVKFNWSKVSNASGYNVYYKRFTASSYTHLTRTTGTSVKKAGLSDGVKYTFKVVPYYKSGSTRYASTAYKTASIYTLKEMAKPTAARSSTKVKISWKKINGATGYQVAQYKKQSGKYVKVDSYYTTGSYKLFTAAKGATRYYQIRAYKKVGDKKIYGPWSDEKPYKRK